MPESRLVLFIAALVFGLSVGAASCGSATSGPNLFAAGTYTLRTVNGAPLPAVVIEGLRLTVDSFKNSGPTRRGS